jgi:hypothetical protein
MKATLKSPSIPKRGAEPSKKAVPPPPALTDAYAAFRAKYPYDPSLDLTKLFDLSEEDLKTLYNH